MPGKRYSLKDGVTQSLLTAWDSCPVLAKNILQGWMSPTPSEALFFGSLFHNLLEDHYNSEKMKIDLGKFFDRQRKNAAGISSKITEKSYAMAEALYPSYCTYWNNDDIEKVWYELEPVFDIHFPYAKELGGHRIRGRIDGVFELNDALWLLETKTKSRVDEGGLMEQLNLDFQILFYITAAEKIFEREIKGVLYNVVRKPQLKQKKNEQINEFAERMKDDVFSRPDFYFMRYEAAFTRRAIKEFKAELHSMLIDYAKWVKSDFANSRKRRVSCTSKWNCEFLSACAQNGFAGYIRKRKLFQELD